MMFAVQRTMIGTGMLSWCLANAWNTFPCMLEDGYRRAVGRSWVERRVGRAEVERVQSSVQMLGAGREAVSGARGPQAAAAAGCRCCPPHWGPPGLTVWLCRAGESPPQTAASTSQPPLQHEVVPGNRIVWRIL